MSYYKQTSQIRTEVKNGYCYVRNLSEKGGVIEALLSEKNEVKVSNILQSVTEETFSQVWDKLIGIKGVRFEFRSN